MLSKLQENPQTKVPQNFKKVAEIPRKMYETPPKGPFDRNEERLASGKFVDPTKDVLKSSWLPYDHNAMPHTIA